ncbi:MAG: hypothetical protein H6719_30090 [Sandaracinaceae bacterium]|nr:hypothetical protein [Sandaracinaceae bacterium]
MRRLAWLLALSTLGCKPPPATPLGDDAAYEDLTDQVVVEVLTEDGGRVDWGAATGLVAFDRLGADGFFDVWTMRPDGTDARCLTCETPGLPTRNVGQPAWHPSGEWLVVQAEKAESDARAYASHPGRGSRNDLWLVRADGASAYPLTDVPDEAGHGVLHPHFFGDVLTWSQMVGGVEPTRDGLLGFWELRRATLALDPEPHLEDARATDLGHDGFFESHGLSPDGARWIFSANLGDTGLGELNDIYTIDAESLDDLEPVTTAAYNEHATFTPDGARVVWMSNAGNRDRSTDWWWMGTDGAGLARLTRIDDGPGRAVAADLSFGPDGRSFVGYVQRGVGGETGSIVRVTLPEE